MNRDMEKLGEEIQSSFLTLLKTHLPNTLLEKVKNNKPLKIISIACGKFIEAECLYKYFSGYEKLIKLYGIEINKELCNSAKERLKGKAILKLADASVNENYTEWIQDGLFDLIIVRHPEITFNTEVFIKIFSNCQNLLNKDGYLLVTTHLDNEVRAVKPLLQLVKFNLITEAENQNAASQIKDGKPVFADKYLLLNTVSVT